jgi:hypothetical protein
MGGTGSDKRSMVGFGTNSAEPSGYAEIDRDFANQV